MRKTDLESYLKTCSETSRVLESLEEDVLQWAVYKEKVLKSFNNLMRKKRKLTEKFPEQWHGLTVSQVATGYVFAHSWRTRKFLRAHGDALRTEQKSLLQYFTDEPWFYSVLKLEDDVGNDFFTVVDVASMEELLLYSPTVRDLSRTGVGLYLILLFYNGDCYQTFGPIHHYRGFQPYDFEYFAKQLSPDFYRENGLSATIANNPAAFQLLDAWTESPPFGHRDKIMQVCADEIALSQFDPGRFAKKFDIETKESVVRCKLKGEDNPFRSASVYYDGHKKKLFVYTSGLELYQNVRANMEEEITLPEEPYWLATMNMSLAAKEILDKDVPAASYLYMFGKEPEPVSPDQQEQLDKLNTILSEVSRHRNEGIAFSPEDLARKHGVEVDLVRQAEAIIDKSARKFDLQIEGGLNGYSAPPPVIRGQFRHAPWDNGVFMFLDSPRVRELFDSLQVELRKRFSSRKIGPFETPPETLDAFPGWLEELYFTQWDERDFTLLNIALHLLCSHGEGMEAVRDYAVEVLRLYWQVFVGTKETQALERFVQKFALFCYEVLYLGGLVDIDLNVTQRTAKKAEFRIEPSPFFRAWASLTGEPT